MKVAIYPGSFNPWHEGHEDVLKKALKVFDEVHIVRFINPEKASEDKSPMPPHLLFDYEGKVKILPEVSMPLVKFLKGKNYNAEIRGLRSGTDLSFEKNQQYWNEDMGMEIPVAFFVTDRELWHVSSSAIRMVKGLKMRKRPNFLGIENWLTGVSGFIASGKSTRCKELEEQGKVVFYADRIAKKIYAAHPEFMEELEDEFGISIINAGEVNWKNLRQEALKHAGLMAHLEQFVRLNFKDAFLKEYDERQIGKEVDVYLEYPLMHRIKPGMFDDLIICEAPMWERVERIQKRDNCSKEEAQAMIDMQEKRHG